MARPTLRARLFTFTRLVGFCVLLVAGANIIPMIAASNRQPSTLPKGHTPFIFVFTMAEPQPITAGKLQLPVKRLLRSVYFDVPASIEETVRPDIIIQVRSKYIDIELDTPMPLRDLRDEIEKEGGGIVVASLVPQQVGFRLLIQIRADNLTDKIEFADGAIFERVFDEKTQTFVDADEPPPSQIQISTPDYVISLSKNDKDNLKKLNANHHDGKGLVTIRIRTASGAVADLGHDYEDWWLDGHDKPMATLTVGNENSSLCEDSSYGKTDSAGGRDETDSPWGLDKIDLTPCYQEFLLVRRIDQVDVIAAAAIRAKTIMINPEILTDTQQFVLANGQRLKPGFGPFSFPNSFPNTISIYREREGCRLYSKTGEDWGSIKFYPPVPLLPTNSQVEDGITVGAGKIFDTIALRKMLNDTAAQLAALSGFNAGTITAAFGNLQGVTRDTSFFSAQATTVPLPGVTSTLANGSTGTTSTSNNLPISGSPGTVTVQCPDGSLPTIGTGGLQGCTAVPVGSNVSGSGSTVTTTPAGTSQQTTGGTTNQQSTQTTTSNSFAPTIPTAPTSTAFSAPSNVGVASADVLAEQVQLNSQITTLRLLLLGATSDQYLSQQSRAITTRQQTTLGFAISLDPPRQYKHAIAEVRIVLVPPPGKDGVSIMNLLPTEKTYNVARVTSHQNSFGAGATIEAISLGVNTGKTKDRLYLAKDTDTLALQYQPPTVPPEKLPFWQAVHDRLQGAIHLNPLNACEPINSDDRGAVVFGWQFRPVLGADYVKGGQRQVFAQLSLPAGLNEDYVPTVFVQTQWRSYNSKLQVVGQAYRDSCSIETDKGGVSLLNPIVVRDLKISDIGNGQVRLTAKGDFFSSGLLVRSGANNVSPTTFDGTSIDVFGSLHDILQAGDLKVLAQNGIQRPFAIVTDPSKSEQCGITEADMMATPQPDGTAKVQMHMRLGASYNLNDDDDGAPNPYVLIGPQVYGIQEAPFLDSSFCARMTRSPECNYYFLAPTVTLRNAQNFMVQDIAWDSFKKAGSIQFAPSFDKVTTLTGSDQSNGQGDSVYAVSGFDLENVANSAEFQPTLAEMGSRHYELQAFVGNLPVPDNSMEIMSDNELIISLTSAERKDAKTIRFVLTDLRTRAIVEWDLSLPVSADASGKGSLTASPAFLYKGDSQAITLSNSAVDFSTVKDVLFDGKVYFTPQKTATTPKPDSSKFEILISTDITKEPGKKEFTVEFVDSHGKQSKSTFAIEVVRR